MRAGNVLRLAVVAALPGSGTAGDSVVMSGRLYVHDGTAWQVQKDVLVLNSTDPIPAGTPAGTAVLRTGGTQAATTLSATGLTGATSATRWVGATASGAPASGTFLAGDWVVTLDGHVFVCTAGGSPGTWVDAGGGVTYATTAELANVSAASENAGTSSTVARGDHKHDINTGTPVALSGASPALGASTNMSRADHNHGLPSNMDTTDTAQTITGQKTLSFASASSALIILPTANATSGAPLVNSPRLYFGSRYWNGAASADANGINLWSEQEAANTTGMVLKSDAGLKALSFAAMGQSGAATATRYVGGTTSGAPSAGTFVTGDWVVAQNGHIFVCTAGGTPGTWVDAAGSGPANGMTTDTQQTVTAAKIWSILSDTSAILLNTSDNATVGATTKHSPVIEFQTKYWNGSSSQTEAPILQARRSGATAGAYYLNASAPLRADTFQPGGLTGATAVSRYVGAVSGTEAPASGTFAVGDWCITQLGSISVCTVAGSPGTWVTAYSDGNPPLTLLKTEGTTPGTPAAGLLVEWVSSADSRPYWKNDVGDVGAMWNVEPYTFSVTGTVAVATGKSKITLEGNYVIETVRVNVNTAPTGASLIVDVNKNGTTIYTTQSARPTIAAAATTATGNSPAITTFAAGDVLTVDVDQVGSTVAGADLTVTIRLRRVA